MNMHWLSLVSEDNAVQRLQAEKRPPAATSGVASVPAYPTTHSAHIADRPATNAYPARERRKEDRRKGGDRRKEQVPVLLDTRSKHDRRGIENRRRTEAARKLQRAARARINVYA